VVGGIQTDAIHGHWTSPFLSLSIDEKGTFATRMPDGSHSEGHWSLDADSRLHADFMGAPITADVSIDGDELTLVLDSQAIRLPRATSEMP
jgi:hypothetical protein